MTESARPDTAGLEFRRGSQFSAQWSPQTTIPYDNFRLSTGCKINCVRFRYITDLFDSLRWTNYDRKD